MNKNKLKKPRKSIHAEINKNLGDNPERIAKNIKVDPRPTSRPEEKNRYTMILEAKKTEKRIRDEKKLLIPHMNKRNIVKRWKVEAEETNLSLEEIEYEVEGEQNKKFAIEVENKLKIEEKIDHGKLLLNDK